MSKKLIFLDTEVTGFNEKGLIQFAGFSSTGESMNLFIKTDKKMELGALATHHITQKKLEEKGVELHSVKGEIEKFCHGQILIAHNADFDKSVLEINGINLVDEIWIDTYPLAYNLLTDDDMQHNLQYLRYYFFEDDFEGGEELNPHDALSDVIVLQKVFDELIRVLKEKTGITDDNEAIEEAIKISNQGIILRIFSFGKHIGKKIADVAKSDRGYLEWLLGSELQKPEGQQNKNMVNTLNYYLK